MKRFLVVALFLEIGFVLIVIPWLAFWDRNYFAQLVPSLRAVMTNNFVRGAVSGLGLIDVAVGLAELVAVMAARSSERPISIHPPRFTEDRDVIG